MKVTRVLGALLLVLLLGVALAACQKQGETVSETGTDQGTAVTDQTAPSTTDQAAQAPAQPEPNAAPAAGSQPAKKPSSGHASSGSKGSSASYVTDANMIRVPTGTVFDVAMVTPADTRTSNV